MTRTIQSLSNVKKYFSLLFMAIILLSAVSALSSPAYRGTLDTSVYLYGSNNSDLNEKTFYAKAHEWVLFDMNIAQGINFHLNNRFAYWYNSPGDQESVDLNMYYFYFDFYFL